MGLQKLLKQHGFNDHPFQTWIAEDEMDLTKWFVPPPFLDTVIGKTGKANASLFPSSNLIFGRPGSGKTAIRKAIEMELLTREPKALILRYVSFIDVMKSSSKPSLKEHIEEILKLATIGLIAFMREDFQRYSSLSFTDKCELAGLVSRFYENLPPMTKESYVNDLNPVIGRLTGAAKVGKKALVDLYNTTISILNKEKIDATSWKLNDGGSDKKNETPILLLQRLWSLARKMGANSIWVLIDGVDEASGASSPEAIFNAISALLVSLPVMEFRGGSTQRICFKVFLTRPDEVKPLLKDVGFRFDRLKTEDIKWHRKDLNQCLMKRLAFYSNNRILTFDQICLTEAKGTHDLLLDSAELRPRTLFRMAHEILAEFQRRSNPEDVLIDEASIKSGIDAGKSAVFG